MFKTHLPSAFPVKVQALGSSLQQANDTAAQPQEFGQGIKFSGRNSKDRFEREDAKPEADTKLGRQTRSMRTQVSQHPDPELDAQRVRSTRSNARLTAEGSEESPAAAALGGKANSARPTRNRRAMSALPEPTLGMRLRSGGGNQDEPLESNSGTVETPRRHTRSTQAMVESTPEKPMPEKKRTIKLQVGKSGPSGESIPSHSSRMTTRSRRLPAEQALPEVVPAAPKRMTRSHINADDTLSNPFAVTEQTLSRKGIDRKAKERPAAETEPPNSSSSSAKKTAHGASRTIASKLHHHVKKAQPKAVVPDDASEYEADQDNEAVRSARQSAEPDSGTRMALRNKKAPVHGESAALNSDSDEGPVTRHRPRRPKRPAVEVEEAKRTPKRKKLFRKAELPRTQDSGLEEAQLEPTPQVRTARKAPVLASQGGAGEKTMRRHRYVPKVVVSDDESAAESPDSRPYATRRKIKTDYQYGYQGYHPSDLEDERSTRAASLDAVEPHEPESSVAKSQVPKHIPKWAHGLWQSDPEEAATPKESDQEYNPEGSVVESSASTDSEEGSHSGNKIIFTPLHDLITNGKDQFVDEWLPEMDRYRGEINQTTGHLRQTPIACAASQNKSRMIAKLIELGARLDITNELRQLPIHLAAENDNSNALRELLAAHQKEGNLQKFLREQDALGGSVAHAAAKANSSDCLKILSDFGADLDAPDARGRTPMHIAAEHGAAGALYQLYLLGASPYVKIIKDNRNTKQTPAHLAAKAGHLQVFQVLNLIAGQEEKQLHGQGLKQDADKVVDRLMHRRDDKGKKPIEIAKGHQHDDIVDFLIKEVCPWWKK